MAQQYKYDILWVAFDVEANGPDAVNHCAIQYGFVVIDPNAIVLDVSATSTDIIAAAIVDKVSWPVAAHKPDDPVTFDEFWSKNLDHYNFLKEHGRPIDQVMQDFSVKLSEWKSMCRSLRFCAAPVSFDVQYLAHDYAAWIPGVPFGGHGELGLAWEGTQQPKPKFPFRMDCTSTLRDSIIDSLCASTHPQHKKAVTEQVRRLINMWKLPHTHDAMDDALHQGLEHMVLRRVNLRDSFVTDSGLVGLCLNETNSASSPWNIWHTYGDNDRTIATQES